jgi:glucokinase
MSAPSGSVVGIDVGGTTIKAGRFSSAGTLLDRSERRTPGVGAEIAGAVAEVAAQLRTGDTLGVAVVLPGVVDRSAGVVRWAVNLGWRDVPLRAQLASELGLPVAVEHDVTAAALAEQAATGGDLLYVGLGTGIGAAHVVDGAVRTGATGLAGEIGHVTVRSAGEPCACGRSGCLEVYASGSGVARRYAAAGGPDGATAADVVAAQRIDPAASQVWSEATAALGLALATATLLLDPKRIVLGGGLSQAGAQLVEPVNAALSAQLPWRPAPPLSLATLGTDAGIRGAALVATRLARSGVVVA